MRDINVKKTNYLHGLRLSLNFKDHKIIDFSVERKLNV